MARVILCSVSLRALAIDWSLCCIDTPPAPSKPGEPVYVCIRELGIFSTWIQCQGFKNIKTSINKNTLLRIHFTSRMDKTKKTLAKWYKKPRRSHKAPSYRTRWGMTKGLSFTPGRRIFQELKHDFLNYGGAMNLDLAAAGVQLAPTTHGSGADSGAFLGYNVQGKYFKMRYTIQNGGENLARCRIIVVKDYMPPAGNMYMYANITNYNALLLRTADVVSDLTPIFPRRFEVLFDKTHLLETAGSGRSQVFQTEYVPLNGEVQSFTRDVAATSLSPLNWRILIFQYSDVTSVGLTYVADYAYTEAA